MGIDRDLKIKNKILIEPEMFYSNAFKSLSKSQILTLMRCLQKRRWVKTKVKGGRKQNVYINDGFIFPYAEAKGLGIAGTTQHWKNINKLIEVGFLEMVHQGGWYQRNEKTRDYSVFKNSDRWKQYGKPEFKMVEKPKVLQPAFHIRNNLKRKNNFTNVKESSSQK